MAIRRQAVLRIILKFNNTVLRELKIDQDEIIIGRDASNDIQIDNMAVSREHAKIVTGPDYYFIEDLNSTNGTFVNGKKIKKKFLKEDDEISIGKHALQIFLEENPEIMKERKIKGIDSTYRLEPAEYKRMFKNQIKY
jgi:pSer/pThr/pTyr-binding forkhead associated (FHA) protein